MRISELIKELEKVKEMRGDLLVAAFTDENYYINLHLEVVNNTNTNLKNSFDEVVIINEPYFLGIY
ncbi:hypothetical protein HPU229334_00590 [Helicobacter pullorum]|uniref:Uncharacterized protein n=1 Tax=Helicobacter pullorum TaxID=35818 RepID=A0A0N0LT09_9HELI|nr:hypothetical protein [Helicobacter pullorum]KPH54669.1 hypothetical protein HPU229334_00590 [Helicobacter pullorum]